MKISTAALAVFLVAVLCYQVSSSPIFINSLDHCCKNYIKKPIHLSRVETYVYIDNNCDQPAVIFTTVKGKRVCARASDRWVQDILNSRKDKAGSG
ncbi:CCL4 protein, partial [Rhinopomastus cyanomelas]|nr:CCL4 protein [Rhinopomastus cyanomelas]